MGRYDDRWGDRPSASERRDQIEEEKELLQAKGMAVAPVEIVGRAITTTFWGKSWCENLERYSDYESRLPRGRSYVRQGAVVDLKIGPGVIKALVSGTRLYKVQVTITRVPDDKWRKLCEDCGGAIDSMVELLQGKLSATVMERMCAPKVGLFPSPGEIDFRCSCPDWATMCKHVAAVLYGVGARLDRRPELLFELRQVKADDLVRAASKAVVKTKKPPKGGKHLVDDDLANLFGVEFGALDVVESGDGDQAPESVAPQVSVPEVNAVSKKPAAPSVVSAVEPLVGPRPGKRRVRKPADKRTAAVNKPVIQEKSPAPKTPIPTKERKGLKQKPEPTPVVETTPPEAGPATTFKELPTSLRNQAVDAALKTLEAVIKRATKWDDKTKKKLDAMKRIMEGMKDDGKGD